MNDHLLPQPKGNFKNFFVGKTGNFFNVPLFSDLKIFPVIICFLILSVTGQAQEVIIPFIDQYSVEGASMPYKADGSISISLNQFDDETFEFHFEFKIPGNYQSISSVQATNGVLKIENLFAGEYFNVRLKVIDEFETWSLPIDQMIIESSLLSALDTENPIGPDDDLNPSPVTLEINCPTLTFTHCNGTLMSANGLQGGFAYNIISADRTCGIEVSDSCTVDNVSRWLCVDGNLPQPLPYSQYSKTNYLGVGLSALAAARVAWIICNYDYPPNHQHPIIHAIWKLSGTGGQENAIYLAAVNAVPEPDGSENNLVFYKSVIEGYQDYVNWQCCQVDGGSISADQVICAGEIPDAFQETEAASGNGSLIYQWQIGLTGCNENDFVDIEGATNTSFQYATPTNQTTYFRRKVTNTINNQDCEAYSNCLVINVNIVPTPIIDSIVQPTCFEPSGSVSFSGLPEYPWTLTINPGNLEFIGNSPNFTVSGLTPDQEYSAILTGQNNCGSTPSEPITISGIPPDPVVNATSNSPVCAGTDVQLTSSVSGGTAPYTFSWSGPNGFTSAVQNPVLVGATSAQSGTYTLLVTDSKGCSGNASVTVVINPNPMVNATSNGPVCAGTDVQLNSSVTGGTAPFSFSWSGPNGYTSAVQNPVLAGANMAQNGTYTLFVTDSKGCSGTASVVVVVNPNPVVNTTSNSPVCAGTDVQLNSSVTGGTPPYTFSWSGPNGYTSAVQNPVLAGATLAQNGIYTLLVTDSKGCSATASVVVVVNPNPVVNATSNSPVCAGTNVQLTSSVTGGTPPFSFSWSGPNGYTSAVQNPVLSGATTAQNGTYTLIVTDSKGCTGTVSVIVVVNPNLTVNITSNSPVCAGTNVQLTSSVTGGTAPFTFSWSGPNGYTSAVQNPVLAGATSAQSGTYTLLVTDSKGCSGTASVVVVINPNPVVNATSNSPVCAGTNVQLTSSVTGGTAPFSFSWSGPNGYTSAVQNPVLAGATSAQSGTYTLLVTDSKGCSGTATVVVVINPNPVVNATSNSPVCAGTDVHLTSLVTGGTAPFTYSWSGPNGYTSTVQNPVLSGATLTQNGIYTLLVTDSKGCSGTASVVVVVNPNPVVNATSNGPVCAGTNLQLTSSVTVGTAPFSFSWSGPNGFTSAVQNPVLVGATSAQSGTYTLEVTDSKGCSGTTSVIVVVNPNLTVNATSNSPVCAGTDVQLTSSGTGGTAPFIFSWSGPNGYTSAVQNPVLAGATSAQSGTYILVVTDSKGCTGTATVVVVVNPNPVVNATSYSPVCAGADVQLTSSVTGGTAPFTYSWSGPNGYTSAVQNPVLVGATSAQSGTYTLLVTDSKGCSGAASVVVVVNPNPVVNATSNGPVCAGTNVQLTSSVTGGTAPYSFSWSGPNGYTSAVQNPVLVGATSAQSGTYILVVTDSKGCLDAASTVLVVNDVPKIISATPSDCKPVTNTYDLNIVIQYNSGSHGNLMITSSEGVQKIVEATSSPQNIIWSDLASNGHEDIDLSVFFQQTPECIFHLNDAYDAPEDCSCQFTGIDHEAICHDAGTQNPGDDYFNIRLKPIGYGHGYTYNVFVLQGDMAKYFGPFPYGVFTPFLGNFLISEGDLEIRIHDTQLDCGFTTLVEAPETCSACTHPVLTAGNIQCNGNTYDVFYYHSEGAVITANAGTVTEFYIRAIPVGVDLELKADLFGCVTELSVKSPDQCNSDCDYPQITLGQPVCNGNTYSVSFTWDGLGNMTRNAGIISGNSVINIPLGVDLFITVTNGTCITQNGVESPESCDEPCVNPLISLSGPLCKASESDYYSVQYTIPLGVEIHVSEGIIGSGIIYHIPISSMLIVTASKEGCEDQVVIIPPPVCEDECTDPVLTVGDIECVGETYNVFYYHSVGSVIQVNAGTIGQNQITGIPLGTELVIIARDGACLTILKVASPQDCDLDCDFSVLTVGQPVCVGSTYSVSFTWDGLGNLNKNAGKIRGNQVVDIPLGIDLILTVTNGACITKITVKAPIDCDCIDPCRKPLITLSGPLCGPVGSDFYSVNYFIRKGVVVISSAGIVGNGIIYNIPNGVSLQVIAQWPGCDDQVVFIPAPECEQPCMEPMLTVGNVKVRDDFFDVQFYHSLPSLISVNAGIIENSQVTGVPEGTVLSIKAIDGACETEIRVTGPANCLEDCIQPQLTVGQGVCTGNGSYKVAYVWNGIGELTRNSGIIMGNEIINIPLDIDLVLTATNCDCAVQIKVISPKDCSEICAQPAVSIGGAICSQDNSTYTITYSADPSAIITSDKGISGTGQITSIPAGLPVVITAWYDGCSEQIISVPAPACNFSSIGNFVWHDLNGDGLQNTGEPGLEGVLIRLYDHTGNVVRTTITNAGGFYEFGQLDAGEYYVEILRPTGYTDFTLSKRGTDQDKDSNFDHANGYGTSSWVYLGSGNADYSVDAGLYKCAEIAGQAWFDENQNNVLDPTETGINGLQIKLFRKETSSWNEWDYTYSQNGNGSGEAGHWNFCVIPGEYYVGVPNSPYGMIPVQPFTGSDASKDSDLSDANGPRTTNAFTLLSGAKKTGIGAGFTLNSTLGNLVWFDANNNGYLDADEAGQQGVSVELFDGQYQVAGNTITDANGEFVFEGLKTGAYFIRVNQPQGYTFTIPKAERDDANGSDVNHANGWGTTPLYPLESGENVQLTAGLVYASLPVELTEFTGENRGNYNYLNWTTEREQNSDRFILERKHADEKDFVPVGEVKAKGFSIEKQNYALKDHNISKSGVYYYRLDQKDRDGTGKLSKMIALEVSKEMAQGITVFPNPARDRFEVRMNLKEKTYVNIQLIDSKGVIVKSYQTNGQLDAGWNSHVIELYGLPAGMYQLKVQTEKQVYLERVMVIE